MNFAGSTNGPSFLRGLSNFVRSVPSNGNSGQITLGSDNPAPANPGTNVQDVLTLSTSSKMHNPYGDLGAKAEKVVAQPWVSGGGAQDSTLIGMLQKRGFSQAEIYAKDEQGRTLYERVADENGLKNPNLIMEGASYVLPSKLKSEKEVDYEDDGALEYNDSDTSEQSFSLTDNLSDAVSVESGKNLSGQTFHNHTASQATLNHSTAENQSQAYGQSDVESAYQSDLSASTTASADMTNSVGQNTALADSLQTVGELTESKAEFTTSAQSEKNGVDGDAVAQATGDSYLEDVQDSQVFTGADAGSSLSNSFGQNEAKAVDVQTVGTATNSTLESAALSSAFTSDAQGDEGDATSEATSAISAESTTDATVVTTADSVAAVDGGEGIAGATAQTRVEVNDAAYSDLNSKATAIGLAENESWTTAITDTLLGKAEQVSVTDSAQATSVNGAAIQRVQVADNQGGVDIKLEADSAGTSAQNVMIDGSSQDAIVDMTATGGQTTQRAVMDNVDTEAPGGIAWSEGENPTAKVVSNGAEFVQQEVSGFRTATQEVNDAKFAPVGNNAQFATYEGTGNGSVTGYHKGKNGKVNIDMEAGKEVFFQDGAAGTHLNGQSTGNSVEGTIASPSIKIDTTKSKDFTGTLVGSNGNDRHEVKFNSGGTNYAAFDQGEGDDHIVVQQGQGNLIASKTSGEMNLAVNMDAGDKSSVMLEAGAAAIRGNIDLSKSKTSNVAIQTSGADHNATVRGGSGTNDVLQIHVSGDEAAPKIVLENESWLDFRSRALESENSQGIIKSSGFEKVVIIRDGEIEKAYDPQSRPSKPHPLFKTTH